MQLKLLGSNGRPLASGSAQYEPGGSTGYPAGRIIIVGAGRVKEDLSKALAYADTAIKLDEKYAPAWALRASVQNMMAQLGLTDTTEGFRKARDDAERAIALDPTLASGYLALADNANQLRLGLGRRQHLPLRKQLP